MFDEHSNFIPPKANREFCHVLIKKKKRKLVMILIKISNLKKKTRKAGWWSADYIFTSTFILWHFTLINWIVQLIIHLYFNLLFIDLHCKLNTRLFHFAKSCYVGLVVSSSLPCGPSLLLLMLKMGTSQVLTNYKFFN